VASGKQHGLGRKRAVGGKTAQAAGADAEPKPSTPGRAKAMLSEEFKEYPKEESADHVDA
jgi:hypothetical protein